MQKRKEGHKIKRYRKIYSTSKTPVQVALRVFLLCCVIAGLGVLGWMSYDPLMAYLDSRQASSASSSEDTEQPEEMPVVEGEGEGDASSAPEEVENAAEDTLLPQTKGVYAPTWVLQEEAELEAFLDQFGHTDVNTVYFDVKSEQGVVLYASSQRLVETAGSQAQEAYDLRMVTQKLKERGLTPVARMYAFRDVTAPVGLRDAAVKYMDTDVLWLDNAPEENGQPWLNPYSTAAQAYLVDIAAEVASAGVDHILLDGVTFPVGVGLSYAGYGENAKTQTREEVLAAFVQLVQKQTAPMNCGISVLVTGKDALGENDQYYGTNPLALSENVCIDVSPEEWMDVGQDVLAHEEGDGLYDSVRILMRTIAADVSGKNIAAMLQLTGGEGAYGQQEVMDQARALADAEISSILYYHPEGDYSTVFS